MSAELIPLCTLTVTLEPPIMVGPTPVGTRVIGELRGVEAAGERLNGKMRGAAGADWLTLSADATLGTVDVRFALDTDDGAVIFVHYNGRLDLSQSPPVVYAAPLFDTGDPRYAWLTRIQAVSKGLFSADMSTLTYEVFEVR